MKSHFIDKSMSIFIFFFHLRLILFAFARSDSARVRELFTRFRGHTWHATTIGCHWCKNVLRMACCVSESPALLVTFPKEKETTRDVSERELIEPCVSARVTCDRSWHARFCESVTRRVESACSFLSGKPQKVVH